MQTTIIEKRDDELDVRVETTGEETARAFRDGLDAFVTQYNLGEAPGETAAEKIKAVFGEDDAQQALLSAVVNYFVPFALHERNIVPLSTYNVNAETDLSDGEPFRFTMTVLPRPSFTLSSYEPVSVTIPAIGDVAESDIDQQIAMLAHQFAHMSQPDASEDELEIPEITDDWVEEHLQIDGVHTVTDLRERFRSVSREELASRAEQLAMDAIMQAWLPRFQGYVSQKMLDAMTEELFETLQSQLAQEGTTLEQFLDDQNLSEDEVRSSLAAQSKDQLIQGFILDAIYRHENLTLEPPDLLAALKGIAPGKEEEALDAFEKSGRSFLLRESAARLKAAQWLRNSSTVEQV